jgi:hypothetical protein
MNHIHPFHAEFGMSSEFDSGDFIPRDDMPWCDTTDHSLSLPTIGIRFSHRTISLAYDVIDCFVTISSYEQVCDSMVIMAQDTFNDS